MSRASVDADFAEVVLEWAELLGDEGISITLTSGFRTLQEQRRLYARLGRVGLAAQPGRSYHNYGLALDFVATPRSAQARAGRLAESLGLRWGGRFHPPDPVHIDAGNYVPIDQAAAEGYPITLVTLEA